MEQIPILLERLYSRPALTREREIFGLRAGCTRTPAHPVLSELALVAEQNEKFEWDVSTAPILFTDRFIKFVGAELPMGIGPHRTAMVLGVHRWADPLWQVVACYIDFSHPRLLWTQESKPNWMAGAKNGTSP